MIPATSFTAIEQATWLLNAHYDERCLSANARLRHGEEPARGGRLRPGKTPGGVEVRAHLHRLIRHIRTRWHNTRITFRGDGHYARPEAMRRDARTTASTTSSVCPAPSLSPKKPTRSPTTSARDAPSRSLPVLRGYTETRHKAQSWGSQNGAPSPILRQQSSALTSVSSSPASISARPSGSTKSQPVLRAQPEPRI